MNLSKRVIILDKLNSPHIAQAIFILKDSSSCEFSAVSEAERIVNEYIAGRLSRKRRRTGVIILSALLAIGIILAIIAL